MIYMLVLLGAGLAFGIYEALNDDDENPDTVINGTEGDDELIGTGGEDDIFGLGGNDWINGVGADDDLHGGNGNDTVLGESGDDLLTGGEGLDILMGGEGDDILRGAEDNDTLQGDAGNDRLYGDRGDDWIDGGDGDDWFSGGSENDMILGGKGEDTLTGDGGDDILSGGEVISRGLTAEEFEAMRDAILSGGSASLPGDVTYSATDDGEADILDGGLGDDLLLVGAGDQATGGEDADDFYLLGGTPADPAQIMDFNSDEDTLVYVHDAGSEPPTLSVVDNDDGTQTLAADGETVAILTGSSVSVSDIVFYERESTPGFVA